MHRRSSRLSDRSERGLEAAFRAFAPPLRVAELTPGGEAAVAPETARALADLAAEGPLRVRLRETVTPGVLHLEAERDFTTTTHHRGLRLA